MSLTKQFNGLGGTIASRESLLNLQTKAKTENNKEVYNRVTKFLEKYPKATQFELEIDTPIRETRGLGFPITTEKKGEELHYIQDKTKVASINKYGVITWHKKGIPTRMRTKIRKDAKAVGLGAPQEEDISGMLGGLDLETEDHEQIYGLGKAVSVNEIYDMVTQRMLDLIKAANKGDYKRAWNDEGYLIPYNFVSKKAYRGINNVMLSPLFGTLSNPYFLTFAQIKEKGGKLRKGSESHKVVYFSKFEKEYTDTEIERINSVSTKDQAKKGDKKELFFLKYYNVFSGADIEGINFDLDNFEMPGKVTSDIAAGENEKIDIAEQIVKHYPKPSPEIIFTGNKASFTPGKDLVTMPPIEKFKTAQDYYRTLFHELSHSTGHKNRLARDFSGQFGSPEYAFEELTAEFGAVFLSAQAGIMFYTNKNHAGYLKGWNEVLVPQLENDNRFLMRASSQAQKAADFILQPDKAGVFVFMKKSGVDPLAKKTTVLKVNKKASDYGKKTVRVKKETKASYPFARTDIPYEVAYRAHTGTSFSPEKRAVQEQETYFGHLESTYNKYKGIAIKNDKLEVFEKGFSYLQSGYLKRKLALLHSRNGFMSTMITGAGNFPFSRMNKKSESIHTKEGEIYKFLDYAEDKLKNSLRLDTEKPIKAGSDNALDLLKQKLVIAEKEHAKNLLGNKIMAKFRKLDLSDEEKFDLFFAELAKNDFSDSEITSLKRYMRTFRYGVSGFHNTNSNARIKTLKEKIAREEKLQTNKSEKGNTEYVFDEGTVVLNRDINRIQILFEGKPNEETRADLKKGGLAFRWSPKEGAWQRQLNTFGQYGYSKLWSLFPSLKESMQHSKPKEKEEPKVDVNGQTALFGALNAPDTEVVFTDIEEPVQADFIPLPVEKVNLPLEIDTNTTFPEEKKVITPEKNKSSLNRNSLAYRRQNRSNANHEYYIIGNPDISEFLGHIEKKKKESVAITIAGGQGSGKTSFVFQLINAFAQNYKVGHASIEEHPDSALYESKAERFWDENAKNTVDSPEINSMQDIHNLILRNDVIVIDSFSKLLSMDRKITLDDTFRKKYDGKLFIIIYQLTADGSMRGGSSSQFDGDIISFVEKFPDFKDNYVYFDKNRYQDRSLDELKYNIASAKLVQEEDPEEELEFTEVERI
ncbi:Antirestriction protein ArdC [Flavobacterium gillisiae]|uniref:Antirestriction protein ArdC n=1 Tax=Flavobacterium gillisiae TaxID=150146 RepID=A0A1H3WTN7_9FLAO|nr:zincin-like metallopeptidase domain-containing protein [Flavobacterium gillisiae]SDZ90493.1 Antirestriction protein ArdC [Flavobacterium gillisiae]